MEKANKNQQKKAGKIKEGAALTELVFILDRSGSMAGLESDVVGGFNSVITKQKELDGEAFVTTVLFDDELKTLHDRIRLADMSLMTKSDYIPRGCTALYDAIGYTVKHIMGIHKYARKEDVPDKTIVVITTDGMENSSSRYNRNMIRELIAEQTEKAGWEFMFLAANIDVFEEAEGIGINRDKAISYDATPDGVARFSCIINDYIECERNGDEWKNPDKKRSTSKKKK